ncbi:MAG: (2Fe-2S)-binding protein [Rhodobacteraceae bacterium]|nr:(2Fe-2S)-binding protein [Paracoccaceae bacterium]
MTAAAQGRIVRLAETARRAIRFWLDGQELRALEGDTVLTAILLSAQALRDAEFGPERRAGFCLMEACQDCWLWPETGARFRACSTQITKGMRLRSWPPGDWPASGEGQA